MFNNYIKKRHYNFHHFQIREFYCSQLLAFRVCVLDSCHRKAVLLYQKCHILLFFLMVNVFFKCSYSSEKYTLPLHNIAPVAEKPPLCTKR